jgi:hypothetical protein
MLLPGRPVEDLARRLRASATSPFTVRTGIEARTTSTLGEEPNIAIGSKLFTRS